MNKNTRNKIIYIILYLIFLFVDIQAGYFYSFFSSSRAIGPTHYEYGHDYYKAEEYILETEKMHFRKEYYDKDYKIQFSTRKLLPVNDKNKLLTKYIEVFLTKAKKDNYNSIDFDAGIITSDDYYDITHNNDYFYLAIYDSDERILYILSDFSKDIEFMENE